MSGILIFYESLPEDLRTGVEADAEEKGITAYDLVRDILSERYGLAYEGSGLPYRPTGERFKLRVAPNLRKRINMEAAKNGGTIRGVVLSALASHYGLAPIDQARRPRSAP